ncbi:MAG: hypothetical protein A2161_00290 [Candidatus Schekmanbacteria bacterium RBG_13_48_7]|uniref:Glycosyltransferase RgtA/B/C/D-like domain-containing protein n=1 Tax=Candidatus Schekmanbacteria bacterium RBG_13_48_7 TaxID=1817878 RepID=A0A1F7S702_9BACT|nr:MAG: hypothetical protein A2161_00290 [Candidatus Schekmanbacteria bacterium RBG_13_48_7]
MLEKSQTDNYIFYLDILLIICAAGLLFLPTLGSYGLWDPWEPMWAQTAREMMDKGVWITPIYRLDTRLIHPPFVYWIIRISYSLIGVSEFAARFPVVLFSIFGCVLNYIIFRKFVSRTASLLSSFIWLTTPMFNFLSRNSTADAVFCVSENLAFLCFLGSMLIKNERRIYAPCFYLFLSIAVLTKGPFALFLMVIFLILLSLVLRSLKPWKSINFLPGIILFVILTVPWFILVYHEQGTEFIQKFFSYQTQIRFTEGFREHNHGFFFYFKTLPLGFFPWSAFFLPGLIFLLIRKSEQKVSDKNYPVISILVFIFSIFTVYSIFPAKIHHFILPVFPGMAWIVGIFLDRIMDKENSQGFIPCFSVSIILYLLIVGYWYYETTGHLKRLLLSTAPILFTFTVKGIIPANYEPRIFLSVFVILIGLLILLTIIFRFKYFIILIVGWMWISLFLFNNKFIPEISKFKSMKYMVESYQRVHKKGEPVAMVGAAKNSVFFYTNNEILRINGAKSGTNLINYLNSTERVFAILDEKIAINMIDYLADTFQLNPVIVDNSHMSLVLIANRDPRTK